LDAHEHIGQTPPARLPIEEFKFWFDLNNLIHLPTRGAEFTWTNGRGGVRHTERKLDRAFCNQAWLDLSCSMSVSTLIKQKSDHYPLLLDMQVNSDTFASHFKFVRMWTTHPDCKSVIKDSWRLHVIGCPMFVLSSKLKTLKDTLKVWNKNCFGNVHNFVKQAEQDLQTVQELIQVSGHSDELLDEEKKAQKHYEEALNREEMFGREKARLN